MDTLSQLGFAFVGAVLSYLLPIVISNHWYRKHTKLVGEWRSSYILPYDAQIAVADVVEIKPYRGKLRFMTLSSSYDDPYVAYGKLVADCYVVGRWESTKYDGKGTFMLAVHPLGEIMYGFYFGVDRFRKTIHGTWVLAKARGSEAEIEKRLAEGEDILNQTKLVFPCSP